MEKYNQRSTQLHAILLTHFNDKEEYSKKEYRTVNEDFYTLADLIARQWLNNGCDGFNIEGVDEGYRFIVENLEELRAFDMISPNGSNVSGATLWKDWGLS